MTTLLVFLQVTDPVAHSLHLSRPNIPTKAVAFLPARSKAPHGPAHA